MNRHMVGGAAAATAVLAGAVAMARRREMRRRRSRRAATSGTGSFASCRAGRMQAKRDASLVGGAGGRRAPEARRARPGRQVQRAPPARRVTPVPVGPAGPKGDPGTGVRFVDGLGGTPCTTFDGGAGKVEVGATATDLITFTCEASGSPPPPASGRHLVINEVDYDQVGADTGGFVEIANTGTAAAVLDAIAVVLVNGGRRRIRPQGAHRQPRPRREARCRRRPTERGARRPRPGGDGENTLLDALSYEGAITAATIGTKTFDLVEGTMLPVDVADSNTAEGTLARIPDATDTGERVRRWAFTTTPTPGAANVGTS